jgi:hypothetical protein
MPIQRQKTRKLFYNKWPIRIECRLSKAGTIARIGTEKTLLWLEERTPGNDWFWKGANISEIRSFVKEFKKFEDKEIQLRGEGSHFNIFLKDKALAENIIKDMKKWIVAVTEPGSEEEYEFLLGHNKKVICDDFPKGKYRYKIYLRTGMKPEVKTRFKSWMVNYGDSFNIANNTELWLMNKKPYIQDPFFYVLDQHNLSMCGLYLGDNIKKVEEFIPRSRINTSCPI